MKYDINEAKKSAKQIGDEAKQTVKDIKKNGVAKEFKKFDINKQAIVAAVLLAAVFVVVLIGKGIAYGVEQAKIGAIEDAFRENGYNSGQYYYIYNNEVSFTSTNLCEFNPDNSGQKYQYKNKSGYESEIYHNDEPYTKECDELVSQMKSAVENRDASKLRDLLGQLKRTAAEAVNRLNAKAEQEKKEDEEKVAKAKAEAKAEAEEAKRKAEEEAKNSVERLASGDCSAIAGDWKNGLGYTMTIYNSCATSKNGKIESIKKLSDGSFSGDIVPTGIPDGWYGSKFLVYPVGVISYSTAGAKTAVGDSTKIRLLETQSTLSASELTKELYYKQ
jgi:hypothetical protein